VSAVVYIDVEKPDDYADRLVGQLKQRFPQIGYVEGKTAVRERLEIYVQAEPVGDVEARAALEKAIVEIGAEDRFSVVYPDGAPDAPA
jgi:hypothetical protein